MRSDSPAIKRRTFLKQGALAGLGILAPTAWPQLSWSASKERLMILSSIGLDTLHPYAHSSGPQYGIWQHMIEPLVEINYARKDYYGVLAESWKFQGNTWVFRLRKGIRFHDGSPFTAQDVIHSVNRIRNDKRSLQKSNFDDLTEVQSVPEAAKTYRRHSITLMTELCFLSQQQPFRARQILVQFQQLFWWNLTNDFA